MFKRLSKLWKLSAKDDKAIETLLKHDVDLIPDEGDGKAEFIPLGSEQDYEDFKKEEDGTDKWYKRILNL